jgi:hypothetical protein
MPIIPRSAFSEANIWISLSIYINISLPLKADDFCVTCLYRNLQISNVTPGTFGNFSDMSVARVASTFMLGAGLTIKKKWPNYWAILLSTGFTLKSNKSVAEV